MPVVKMALSITASISAKILVLTIVFDDERLFR